MPFVVDIDPVAFSLLGIPVRWYGLTLIVAAGVAIWLAQRGGRRRGIVPEIVPDARDRRACRRPVHRRAPRAPSDDREAQPGSQSTMTAHIHDPATHIGIDTDAAPPGRTPVTLARPWWLVPGILGRSSWAASSWPASPPGRACSTSASSVERSSCTWAATVTAVTAPVEAVTRPMPSGLVGPMISAAAHLALSSLGQAPLQSSWRQHHGRRDVDRHS